MKYGSYYRESVTVVDWSRVCEDCARSHFPNLCDCIGVRVLVIPLTVIGG